MEQKPIALLPQYCSNYWAVMLFFQGWELGLPNKRAWVNVKNFIFENPGQAMEAYCEIPCPASQLIEARTENELYKNIAKMRMNFQNEAWLQEYLYPYI